MNRTRDFAGGLTAVDDAKSSKSSLLTFAYVNGRPMEGRHFDQPTGRVANYRGAMLNATQVAQVAERGMGYSSATLMFNELVDELIDPAPTTIRVGLRKDDPEVWKALQCLQQGPKRLLDARP